MTCAQAVVDVLQRHGPPVVFGYPGAHTVLLHAAVCREPSLRHVLVRHEQGAAFAADGYARASGGAGVFITTAGPGATNALTAVAESYTNSIPTVHVSAQVDRPYIGTGLGAWHETDLEAIFKPVTKWNATASEAADAPALTLRALAEAVAGRPRTTQICIPRDLLDQPSPPPDGPADVDRSTALDADEVAAAARALAEAERPVILAGGGSQGASSALRSLARAVGAGVATTCMGKGAFADDDPLSLGAAWGAPAVAALAEADACLAVGCRFTEITTRTWAVKMPSSLIHIDIDPDVIDMHYPATAPVVGDAGAALEAIASEVAATPRDDWRSRVAELRAADRAALNPDALLCRVLRGAIPREAMIVGDVATLCYHMFNHFDVYEPNGFLYPSGYIAMGYGLPAAIGAHFAQPDRPVVCLAGDGSFCMTATELATAVQDSVPVKIILLNNSRLEAIAHFAGGDLDDMRQIVDLRNPDFVSMSKSFGVHAERIPAGDTEGLESHIAWLMREEGPALLEVLLD